MVTLAQLRLICPHSPSHVLLPFVDPLNEAMAEFEINTTQRQVQFLAQVAHESGGFHYVREIASGAAYDHRDDLGNTKPAAVAVANKYGSTPGRWWRGHGLMQITGYDNHVACGDALGLDLVGQPYLLEEPVHAARSAGWFWTVGAGLNLSHHALEAGIPVGVDLNDLADRADLKKITLAVNGGFNGLADRVAYHDRAVVVLA